eukprot:3055699-Amphidinium_carterae.1
MQKRERVAKIPSLSIFAYFCTLLDPFSKFRDLPFQGFLGPRLLHAAQVSWVLHVFFSSQPSRPYSQNSAAHVPSPSQTSALGLIVWAIDLQIPGPLCRKRHIVVCAPSGRQRANHGATA